MNPLRELYRTLNCPDDGGGLRLFTDSLECVQCQRQYPILARNMIELLSLEPAPPDDCSPYASDYQATRSQRFEWRPASLAWGAPEYFPKTWVERKRRQVAAVRSLILDGAEPRILFCDFSAGAGYYTLAYAKDWRHVAHCDLSVDSLNYAHRKAEKLGLENILFIRMDYLRPAFRRSLQCVICLDSLIRGEWHERRLLESIHGSLAPDGAAVVDFHNWWHNPIRRLGLLRNNFGPNRSYSKTETARLLASVRIAKPQCFPFHQEIDPSSPLRSTLERVLPSTRWMYRFSGAGLRPAIR
jgi:SAM-dependent methyltransferase